MKILLVGDVHIKHSNLNEVSLLMNKIIETCNSYKPDLVVQLGDYLDKYKNDPMLLEIAKQHLANISTISKVAIIPGNHEMENNKCFLPQYHALTYIRGSIDNVYLIDKPTIIDYMGYSLGFCPYVEPGRFIEALNIAGNWMNCYVIFAHQEIRGCTMLDNIDCRVNPVLSSSGDAWDNQYPYLISGHIHKRQFISGNVYYTGSCLQNNYGELQNKTLTKLNIDNHSITTELVSIGIKSRFTLDIGIDDLDSLIIPMDEDNKNSKLRLRITGEREKLKKVNYHNIIIALRNHFNLKLETVIILEDCPDYSISSTHESYMEGLIRTIYTGKNEQLLELLNEIISK